MRNSYVVGVSAVALSAALGMSSVQAIAGGGAPRVLTVSVADYNAALVKQAGDILTVPSGLATYAVNAGSLEINSRFTVTLPTNFTFGSQPSFAATSATTFALTSGGIGSQSATFIVGTTPLVAGQSVALNTFSVAGATALETPIPVVNALPISLQSTNNALITNNDPAPLTKPAFGSEPGASAIFVGAIQFIDLTSPVLGTKFGTDPAQDSPTAVLSAIAISPELVDAATQSVPVLQPSGALNTLSTADTATVSISGLFNGITSAFSSATSDCTTPASTGTVSPSQLTIPGVAINTEVFFCVTSNGTTLLTQNPNGFQPTVTPGTSTDFIGAGVNNEFPGLWTYFGGGVLSVTNFFTGDDSGYSSLLRVNNAGTGPVNLFALAQPDTGGTPLIGSLGSLGAGIGTVFTEPQIATATGLDLPNSGQRATMQLIVTGDFGDVAASSFLVNPSGVVTNVGVLANQPVE
jgi:hypothetical protein